MRSLVSLAAVSAVLCLSFRSLDAHHSPTQFDQQRDITIVGVVTAVEWINPHVRFHVQVPSSGGQTIFRLVEAQSPRVLSLFGWLPTSLRRGDRVTVSAHPERNGATSAALGRSVRKQDGTELQIPWDQEEIRRALRAQSLER